MASGKSSKRPRPAEPVEKLFGGRTIAVRGAREHNLKNVDLTIPRDKLVVITGLSGSGKSSLAFDTIYAEGQRRYVESLSAYARQFLEMMEKPDVDQIEGLSPAISIEQKTTSKQPALDRRHRDRDLRLHAPAVRARRHALFAGDRPADRKPDGQPDGRPRAGAARAARGSICSRRSSAAARASTARSSPDCRSAASSASRSTASSTRSPTRRRSTRRCKHDIEVVVDRLVVRADIGEPAGRQFRDRARARRTAWRSSNSPIQPAEGGEPRRIVFSRKFACPVSGFTIRRDRAAAVLVQQPLRRLPGLRRARLELYFDPELVVPEPRLIAAQGRDRALGRVELALLSADAGGARPPLQVPPRRRRGRTCRRRRARSSCNGSGDEEVALRLRRRPAVLRGEEAVRGRRPQPRAALPRDGKRVVARGARRATRPRRRARPASGYRLKPEALAVKIAGQHIGEVSRLSVGEAVDWFARAAGVLDAKRSEIAQRDPQGDQRPAGLPQRRRPRLPDAVARLGHAVGRREPAHPPRLADRLRPDRRALRARRAVDRPAPARQRAAARHAAAPARPRQHGDRRRARRGHDPRRRLRRRHRPGRGRARRRDRRRRARRPRSRPTRSR